MALDVGTLVATLRVDDGAFKAELTRDKAELASMAKTVNVPLKIDDKGEWAKIAAETKAINAEVANTGRWVSNATHEANKLKAETTNVKAEVALTRVQTALLGTGYQSVGDKVDAAFGKTRKLKEETALTTTQSRLLGLGYQSVGDKVDAAFNKVKTGLGDVETKAKTTRLQAMLLGIDVVKAAETAGAEGGKGFLSGMRGSIEGGMASASAWFTSGLIPVLIGVGIVASPMIVALIGGALSAGILTVLGGGVIAAGIAIAAKDPRVGTAFAALGPTIFGPITHAAKTYFVDPLVGSAGIFTRGFAQISPMITSIFKTLAVQVRPLAVGFTGMFQNLMPGIQRAVEAAGPLISVLAAHLPDIGNAISDFLSSMASAGPGATRFFHDLLNVVQGFIVGLGQAIEMFANMYRYAAAFSDWVAGLFGGGGGGTANSFHELGASSKDAAVGIDAAGAAAAAADPYTKTRNTSIVVMNGSFQAGVSAAGSLAGALDSLNAPALNARDAARNYEAAIDAVTASIKTNGKTLDIHNDKGRANQQVLDGLAKSASDLTAKTYEETLATGGADQAQAAAARTYETGRQALVRAAIQMGMSRQEAEAYARQVMAIPGSWQTYLDTNFKTVNGEIDQFTTKIKGLDGKVVTVTTRLVTAGDTTAVSNTTTSASGAKHTGRSVFRAGGGPVTAGMPYIVGESRPELFVPKVDGMILPQVPPANASHAYAPASTNAGGTLRVIIDGAGILRGIRNEVRLRGGDVQTVLVGA